MASNSTALVSSDYTLSQKFRDQYEINLRQYGELRLSKRRLTVDLCLWIFLSIVCAIVIVLAILSSKDYINTVFAHSTFNTISDFAIALFVVLGILFILAVILRTLALLLISSFENLGEIRSLISKQQTAINAMVPYIAGEDYL